MRTNQTFSISFFIRKKKSKPDHSLIYTRITVNGKSKEISLKRVLPTSKWNQAAGKMQGTGMDSQRINKKIDDTKAKIYQSYEDLIREGHTLTAEVIKSRYLGSD